MPLYAIMNFLIVLLKFVKSCKSGYCNVYLQTGRFIYNDLEIKNATYIIKQYCKRGFYLLALFLIVL